MEENTVNHVPKKGFDLECIKLNNKEITQLKTQ